MIKTDAKTKTTGLFILTALLTVLITGCNKEAEIPPAAEPVDLAQVPDLFEQPLQPNPLALTAEDVIITVNGEEITHGEIMQATQQQMMMLSQQQRLPPQQLGQLYPKIYKEMTDTLVANILLTQAAEKSSLVISDEAVAEEVAKIEANAPEGKNLRDLLAENKMDFDEWKSDLRKQMLVGKLVEEKTAATEEATIIETAAFYEENLASFKTPETVSASHILLKFGPEDTDEAKAKQKADLVAIREQIEAGGNFEELAAKNSDCPSAQQGGVLGSFTREQMVPEFSDAAFGMTVGDISPIVETKFGYHIIKVTDHQEAGVKSLSDVKDQLQGYLTAQKKREALVAYIEELKKNADVVSHQQDFDAGAEQ